MGSAYFGCYNTHFGYYRIDDNTDKYNKVKELKEEQAETGRRIASGVVGVINFFDTAAHKLREANERNTD